MDDIRYLVGSKLVDLEVNVNGFTVLYFENKQREKFAVSLCPTVRSLGLETAPEVPVQEQLKEKFIPEDSNGKHYETSEKCTLN